MEDTTYESLKLKHQVCFPLYAASNFVIRQYKPLLDKLNLTYTQYITMMCLWEYKEMNVKELGKILYLDSGTLTPVLKKLEQKGYITRQRSIEDERSLIVRITEEGQALADQALAIPEELQKCIKVSKEDMVTLYNLLYKVLSSNE